MAIKVYWSCLDTLMLPFAGGADDDDEMLRYAAFDPDDEAAVRAEIRNRSKPELEAAIAEEDRAVFKESLGYFLAKEGFDFGGYFDGWLMSFDHPKDPRQFFIWLWEELFGEPYREYDVRQYVETRGFDPVKRRDRAFDHPATEA